LQRGYKSTPKAHPARAILVQHAVGQAGDARNWKFNLSPTCPRDANRRTMNEVAFNWLMSNLQNDADGRQVNVRVDGILFDATFHYLLKSKNADVNNDLVVDHGMGSGGTNLWGTGMDRFYASVRARLPNKIIVGGTQATRGFASLSGTQMEGWPVSGDFKSAHPNYSGIDALLSTYSFYLDNNDGPAYTETLNKTPTRLYPTHGAHPRPTSNAGFRFSFGMALLDDGFYGQMNTEQYPDPWWDEYAVDVVRGSPTFGHAIASNPHNESRIRLHKGWMGRPLGPRVRLYEAAPLPPPARWCPTAALMPASAAGRATMSRSAARAAGHWRAQGHCAPRAP
jgi:hypothetical protein